MEAEVVEVAVQANAHKFISVLSEDTCGEARGAAL
jgi:hypothetical protein